MVNVRQLNVGKRSQAWLELSNSLHTEKQFDIALVQEPPSRNKIICPRMKEGITFYKETNKAPRSCIYMSKEMADSTQAILLSNLSDKDHTSVQLKIKKGDNLINIILCSIYMPGMNENGNNIVSDTLIKIINHGKSSQSDIIIGCDSNAHHSLWGSPKNDKRGDNLAEYLCLTNLEIVNHGNKPTFCPLDLRRVQTHIDLTIVSQKIAEDIKQWEVSDEDSWSDHKAINFSYSTEKITKQEDNDKKKTDWTKYRKIFNEITDMENFKISGINELDEAAENLYKKIHEAYDKACKKRKIIKFKQKFINTSISVYQRTKR